MQLPLNSLLECSAHERFAQVEPGKWLACEWTIAADTTATVARAGA